MKTVRREQVTIARTVARSHLRSQTKCNVVLCYVIFKLEVRSTSCLAVALEKSFTASCNKEDHEEGLVLVAISLRWFGLDIYSD